MPTCKNRKKNNMKRIVLIFVLGVLWSSLCQASCPMGVYEDRLPTEEQAKDITNIHNEKRLLVARGNLKDQPRGINLKKLKWDWDLSKEALKIAKTCKFAHVSVKDKRFWWVGQNLYIIYSTAPLKGPNWNDAINAWFNEHKLYKFPQPPNKNTGHYTQLVWADTTHVGCASVSFPTKDFKYNELYVCNYGPGGNVGGQNPYKTGTSGCENLC